jgi:putative oxidoreductase
MYFLSYSGLLWVNIFVAAFLAILFLQSGFDKIMNRQSELNFMKEHFAKSPLKNIEGILLTTITVFEITAGTLNALGFLQLLFAKEKTLAQLGILVAALSLTSLFFGQRISKDYAGAVTIVTYFILVILGMWFIFL